MKPCVRCGKHRIPDEDGKCWRCRGRTSEYRAGGVGIRGAKTTAELVIEEWPHMLMVLGHTGAIHRLANAYKIDEQECSTILYTAGLAKEKSDA